MLRFVLAFALCCGLLVAQKVPLATFSGVVHGVSDKRITIENAEGNLVDFDIDHKTRVFRDKKQIHASDLATGDLVTIEARQVMARFLIAVIITVQPKPEQ